MEGFTTEGATIIAAEEYSASKREYHSEFIQFHKRKTGRGLCFGSSVLMSSSTGGIRLDNSPIHMDGDLNIQ